MMDIFYFDKTAKKGRIEDLKRLKNKRIWIDINSITKEEADLLRKTFKLHAVTEDDLLISRGRVKVEQFENYLFTTFYSTEYSGHDIKLVVMEYILGDNFIISSHKKSIGFVERLKKEDYKLNRLMSIGPQAVFHRLLDEQIEEFFPVLAELDDEVEALDEKIALHHDKHILDEILLLKKKVAEIKKITFPQREKMSFLAKRTYSVIPESSVPYFRDTYDNAIRVSEVIENFRDALGSTFDAYMTSVAISQNEVMKVLTIFASISIPLTVIAGVYGTNFIEIPGAHAREGFWWMIVAMAWFTFGMVLYFKKKRWI